jgi:hypothetical protein
VCLTRECLFSNTRDTYPSDALITIGHKHIPFGIRICNKAGEHYKIPKSKEPRLKPVQKVTQKTKFIRNSKDITGNILRPD